MALDPSRYAYIIPATSQFLDENGQPLIGGHCVIYVHGTTGNQYQSFQNFEGTPNPLNIPIDILGYAPAIGLNSQTYDLYVYTANGALFYSRLNIGTQGSGGSSFELHTDNTLKGTSTPSDPLGVNVPEVIGGLVRGIHAESDNVHPRTYQYLQDGSIIVGLRVDEPTFTGGTGVDVTQDHEINIDPTVWQEKLTAGENIQINPSTNVISATDTKYTGGFGITINGTEISLDTDADLQVDYWTGHGSEAIISNDLNSGLVLSRSYGEKVYLNANNEIALKPGSYVVHAFVKLNNIDCTLDSQVYSFNIFGGVLGGDPRIILDFDNSFVHSQEYEISFFTINSNASNDIKLELGTDAALTLNGLRVTLEYVQVYNLNGLIGSAGGGGGGGTVTDVTVNGTSVVSDGVANVTVPTNTSDLNNDSGYLTLADVPKDIIYVDLSSAYNLHQEFEDWDAFQHAILGENKCVIGIEWSVGQFDAYHLTRFEDKDHGATAIFSQIPYIKSRSISGTTNYASTNGVKEIKVIGNDSATYKFTITRDSFDQDIYNKGMYDAQFISTSPYDFATKSGSPVVHGPIPYGAVVLTPGKMYRCILSYYPQSTDTTFDSTHWEETKFDMAIYNICKSIADVDTVRICYPATSFSDISTWLSWQKQCILIDTDGIYEVSSYDASSITFTRCGIGSNGEAVVYKDVLDSSNVHTKTTSSTLPAYSIADAGKTLQVQADGTLAWV